MRVTQMSKSELVRLIDKWRDEHGQPSDASVSRAISPSKSDKLVGAWRNRGISSMPDPTTLANLARFLHVPLEDVVMAAARDAGYLQPRDTPGEGETSAEVG